MSKDAVHLRSLTGMVPVIENWEAMPSAKPGDRLVGSERGLQDV